MGGATIGYLWDSTTLHELGISSSCMSIIIIMTRMVGSSNSFANPSCKAGEVGLFFGRDLMAICLVAYGGLGLFVLGELR